jgi:hypothetical protein
VTLKKIRAMSLSFLWLFIFEEYLGVLWLNCCVTEAAILTLTTIQHGNGM